MEIIDKYLSKSTLTIMFDETVPTDAKIVVCIDNAETFKANSTSGKHDVGYEGVEPNGRMIEVTAPTDLSALVVITIYIGEDSYSTTFLNKYMLFKAQNKHLASVNDVDNMCVGCNEKNWRTQTIAILLRTRLLEYAYENNLVEDQFKFYTDLARVLDFKHVLFESIPEFYNNLGNYGNTLV